MEDKIDKLKKFLQENYPNIQAYNTKNIAGDYMKNVYDEDNIQVDYAPEYDYIEIFGLSDEEFNLLFETKIPVLFAFHGYPSLIKSLIYYRENKNFHIKGYQEEGSITTPFDMRVQNKIDRYNLAMTATNYLSMDYNIEELNEYCSEMLNKHETYIRENGIDIPEVLNWNWNNKEI